MIHLLQPPSLGALTGGFLYNERIANPSPVVELHEVEASALEAWFSVSRIGTALVDSLFLSCEELPNLLREHGAGFLVHHLPTCDPAFPSDQRQAWREREDAALKAASVLVATSHFMGGVVRDRIASADGAARSGGSSEGAGAVRRAAAPLAICEPAVDAIFREVTPATDGEGPVVTVANLEPRKGYLEIIAPLARWLRDADGRWEIVGADADPAYAERVRSALREAGIESRVTLHGRLDREALARVLARSRCHLLPSRFESYGMVVAESLAAGLPVVAYDQGEIANLVDVGTTGLLAPAGDSEGLVDALAKAMGQLDVLRRGCAEQRDRARCWKQASVEFADRVHAALISAGGGSDG